MLQAEEVKLQSNAKQREGCRKEVFLSGSYRTDEKDAFIYF